MRRAAVDPAVASWGETGRCCHPTEQTAGDGEGKEPPLLADVVAADAEHLSLSEAYEGQS